MSQLLVAAIAAALWYGVWSARILYTVNGLFGQTLVISLFFGLVLGDMPTCMIVGASIQSLYLGLVMSGGVVPSDQMLAACVAVPIAVLNDLDPATAISLAVPVGLLGGILVNVRYIVNGLFVNRADTCADNADTKGIFRNGFVYPALLSLVIDVPIVFCAVFFGTGFVQGVVDAIPAWLSNGLSVAGGVLPAIGFALILLVINRPNYLPLFIIGFFMVQYMGLGVMGCAVFAICSALFVSFITADAQAEDDDEDDDDEAETGDGRPGLLTKRDVDAFFWRWYMYCEVPHSYERMQALSLCAAYAPALEKLYGDDREELAAALHRHLAYFNIEAIWGNAVLGVVLAMEESQAATHRMSTEEADAAINGLKTGFMGPLSGIGDTIDWGTTQMLLLGLGLPFASQGSWIGGVIPLLFIPITIVEGILFTRLGYELGASAMEKLLGSSLIKQLIDTTSMIGMMMMGALGSSYVHLSLASEAAQATLDSIVPGLLALCAIFLLNWIIKRHRDKIAWISFGVIAVSLVLSLVGLV
jgi:mannose/fructose/N-acetylgalactosamine-specific phosphotransferase system component IID/mannose/fructose/N-acetylgalactosamine-specific phosphotransferase system component IIC